MLVLSYQSRRGKYSLLILYTAARASLYFVVFIYNYVQPTRIKLQRQPHWGKKKNEKYQLSGKRIELQLKNVNYYNMCFNP